MILERIVLTEADFADLVEGRQVQKDIAVRGSTDASPVRIVLEDIGFVSMSRAVQIAWRNADWKRCNGARFIP